MGKYCHSDYGKPVPWHFRREIVSVKLRHKAVLGYQASSNQNRISREKVDFQFLLLERLGARTYPWNTNIQNNIKSTNRSELSLSFSDGKKKKKRKEKKQAKSNNK